MKTNPAGRVLVIGDDMRIFLAVVRALGRAGKTVEAAPFGASPALTSRYIATVHAAPDFDVDPAGWRAAVLGVLLRNQYDLVIPCSDPAISFLDTHRDQLSHQRLAIPPRAAMPGFYDKVRKITGKERRQLAKLPYDEATWLGITGAPGLHGEKGYSTVERVGARPTLEGNGLLSGCTGECSKPVLPAKAMATISCRLIPDQDPDEVEQQLRQYLAANAPSSIRWELKALAGSKGALTPTDTPYMKAASKALQKTFGVKPVFELGGGSVPIVIMLKEQLGVDSVLLGFGMRDDNIHGPNEHQHLPTYFKGIETYIRFLANLA